LVAPYTILQSITMGECRVAPYNLEFDFFYTIAFTYKIGKGISGGVAAEISCYELGSDGGLDGTECDFVEYVGVNFHAKAQSFSHHSVSLLIIYYSLNKLFTWVSV